MTRLTMALALALMAGCNGDSKDTSAEESDADADADADSDTDADADSDTDADADKVTFSGTVQYDDGTSPEGHVRVQMCSDVCVPDFPAADGSFSFDTPGLDPDTYAFDLVPLNDDGDAPEIYATPLTFVTLDPKEGSVVLAAPVIIYPYTMKGDLEDGEFNAGNGLFIDIDLSTFDDTLDEPKPDYIGAVSFDFATSGLPLEGIAGAVVGSWYLGPFKALANGWSFRIEGYTPGMQLDVYNADYTLDDEDEYGWDHLGTVTVDKDGVLHSPDGGGLIHLSTLLVVAPKK